MDALSKAIEVCGTQGELARRIGVFPQHITNWKKRGIPEARWAAIERATGGQVSRDDLRNTGRQVSR